MAQPQKERQEAVRGAASCEGGATQRAEGRTCREGEGPPPRRQLAAASADHLALVAALAASATVDALRAEVPRGAPAVALLPLRAAQPAAPLPLHLQQAAGDVVERLAVLRKQYPAQCAAAEQQGDEMHENAVRQVQKAVGGNFDYREASKELDAIRVDACAAGLAGGSVKRGYAGGAMRRGGAAPLGGVAPALALADWDSPELLADLQAFKAALAAEVNRRIISASRARMARPAPAVLRLAERRARREGRAAGAPGTVLQPADAVTAPAPVSTVAGAGAVPTSQTRQHAPKPVPARPSGEARKRERERERAQVRPASPPPGGSKPRQAGAAAGRRLPAPSAHVAFGSRCDPPRPPIKKARGLTAEVPNAHAEPQQYDADAGEQSQLEQPDLLRALGVAFGRLSAAQPGTTAAAAAARIPRQQGASKPPLGTSGGNGPASALLADLTAALQALELAQKGTVPQAAPQQGAPGGLRSVLEGSGIAARQVDDLCTQLDLALERMAGDGSNSSAFHSSELQDAAPALDQWHQLQQQGTAPGAWSSRYTEPAPAAAGRTTEQACNEHAPAAPHTSAATCSVAAGADADPLLQRLSALLLGSSTALQQLRHELQGMQQVEAVAEHVTASALQALLQPAPTPLQALVQPVPAPSLVPPAVPPLLGLAVPQHALAPSAPLGPADPGIDCCGFACAADELVPGSPEAAPEPACGEQSGAECNGETADALEPDPWHVEVAAALAAAVQREEEEELVQQHQQREARVRGEQPAEQLAALAVGAATREHCTELVERAVQAAGVEQGVQTDAARDAHLGTAGPRAEEGEEEGSDGGVGVPAPSTLDEAVPVPAGPPRPKPYRPLEAAAQRQRDELRSHADLLAVWYEYVKALGLPPGRLAPRAQGAATAALERSGGEGGAGEVEDVEQPEDEAHGQQERVLCATEPDDDADTLQAASPALSGGGSVWTLTSQDTPRTVGSGLLSGTDADTVLPVARSPRKPTVHSRLLQRQAARAAAAAGSAGASASAPVPAPTERVQSRAYCAASYAPPAVSVEGLKQQHASAGTSASVRITAVPAVVGGRLGDHLSEATPSSAGEAAGAGGDSPSTLLSLDAGDGSQAGGGSPSTLISLPLVGSPGDSSCSTLLEARAPGGRAQAPEALGSHLSDATPSASGVGGLTSTCGDQSCSTLTSTEASLDSVGLAVPCARGHAEGRGGDTRDAPGSGSALRALKQRLSGWRALAAAPRGPSEGG